MTTTGDVTSDPDLSGAVLAGGGSRRMGYPKHRILFNGETLLERQLRILREAGADARWISTGCSPGTGSEALSIPADVRWIGDSESGLGPLAGLSAVLDAVATPWTLVLAVDLPAMTAGFLRRLIALRRGGTGVVPRLTGRYEPLAALYPKAIAPDLQERLRSRNLRLQQMVQEAIASGHLSCFDVPPEDQSLFANWNHPQDLPPEARITG